MIPFQRWPSFCVPLLDVTNLCKLILLYLIISHHFVEPLVNVLFRRFLISHIKFTCVCPIIHQWDWENLDRYVAVGSEGLGITIIDRPISFQYYILTLHSHSRHPCGFKHTGGFWLVTTTHSTHKWRFAPRFGEQIEIRSLERGGKQSIGLLLPFPLLNCFHV